MELDLRKKIFLVVGIIAGLIVAFLLFYFYVYKTGVINIKPLLNSLKPKQATVVVPVNNVVQPQMPIKIVLPSKTTPDDLYAKQVAKIFVERFGSYSNQNNNSQLSEVMQMSTAKMNNWLKTQTVVQSAVYHGFTTRVISSSIKESNADQAQVVINAQITEETASSSKVYYKSGQVNVVRDGADWKVDGFFWDKQ